MITKHGMLDLETAGTGPNAAILTIGMFAFDPYSRPEYHESGWHFVVPFNMNKGRNVDLATIKWWMEQSDEARKASWLDIRDMGAVGPMVDWLNEVDTIWANDPDFDCVILRDFLEQHGVQWRWYRKHRSIRTLKELYDIPFIEPVGTQHNALDDCIYQAEIVRAVYQGKAPPKFLVGNPPGAIKIED